MVACGDSRSSADETRALVKAVMVSVAVHCALLAGLSDQGEFQRRESGVAAKKLQVVTLQRDLPLGGPSAAPLVPGQPSFDSAAPAGSVTPTFSPAARLPGRAPDLSRMDADPSEQTATGELVGRADAEATTVTPSAHSQILDAGSLADHLRAYRIALAVQSRKFRQYPPEVLDLGLGGRAEVGVQLEPNAAPIVSLKKSSGHDALDHAALMMLRRSVEVVVIPESLNGRRLSFVLPVDFAPPQ